MASILILGCTSPKTETPNNGIQLEKGEVLVKLIIDDNVSPESFDVIAAKGSNGLEIMQQVVDVKYNESLYGVFVNEINGIKPAEGSGWSLYVNGVYANKAVDRYSFSQDGNILWKIESFEEMMKKMG